MNIHLFQLTPIRNYLLLMEQKVDSEILKRIIPNNHHYTNHIH